MRLRIRSNLKIEMEVVSYCTVRSTGLNLSTATSLASLLRL